MVLITFDRRPGGLVTQPEMRHDKARGGVAAAATGAIGASILLTITIGILGPSPMVPSLSGPAWSPPYSLDVHPNQHLTIALAAAALVLGGLGLLAALLAIRIAATAVSRIPITVGSGSEFPAGSGPKIPAGSDPEVPAVSGPGNAAPAYPGHEVSGNRGTASAKWHRGLPSARSFVLIGCIAAGVLAFLPPSGSGDHLNYAVYGRMVTLCLSPYTHGAADLPGDPVADAVEEPWREEPSVYGPVATALQAVASWAGGDSLRLTIFVLALFNAAAFIATGLLTDRFTRDDPVRRLRAALLWTANPLLLYHLVAGMHVDTLAVAGVVAALLARARPVGAGACWDSGWRSNSMPACWPGPGLGTTSPTRPPSPHGGLRVSAGGRGIRDRRSGGDRASDTH
ncbi:polyprenol phosphomannose-dependent alpha 1,6 mannosyltransferase MptB [Nonomuraea sp. KM90]|uniref:polyprenol phosphomannose-dependent alpha 1,6 mannosyltransferase MptB n=1 Tax=Nonomuraea sp. KM90 TaxID=3457428 RepID=UPI003FCCB9F0